MSMICTECRIDLQPSEKMPGREGGAMFPLLTAGVWLPDGGFKPVRVPVDSRSNLCFACIGGKLVPHSRDRLEALHVAFLADLDLSRAKVKMGDARWSRRDIKRFARLGSAAREAADSIRKHICFSCSRDLTKDHTVFVYRAIDRARCEHSLSSFGSYQWSNVEFGDALFHLCLACLNKRLPVLSAEFSQSLLGVRAEGEIEVLASPEFVAALMGSGAETKH